MKKLKVRKYALIWITAVLQSNDINKKESVTASAEKFIPTQKPSSMCMSYYVHVLLSYPMWPRTKNSMGSMGWWSSFTTFFINFNFLLKKKKKRGGEKKGKKKRKRKQNKCQTIEPDLQLVKIVHPLN